MAPKWKPKTTWRAKLEQRHPGHGKVVTAPPRMASGRVDASMLIPSPRKVDALVREVPRRSIALIPDLRARLARDAGAELACPLTTGIFLKLVAETSEEDRAGGEAQPAPYWRYCRTLVIRVLKKAMSALLTMMTRLRDAKRPLSPRLG